MSVWWALTAALCSLLAAWCWLWSTRLRTNAPGPRPLPLLGNALYFWKMPAVVEHLRVLQRRHGDVFRFYIGAKLFVVVTRPEDAQKVLTVAKRRDPYFTRPMQTFFGEGLVTCFGNKWKSHRKAIEPAFGREVVSSFIGTFNQTAEFLCERLKKAVGSKMDVHRMLFQSALHSIVETSFRSTVKELLPDSVTVDEITDMLIFGMNIIQKRNYRPWMQPDWTLFFTMDGHRARRISKIISNGIQRAVEVVSSKSFSEERNQKMTLADVLLGRTGGKKFPISEICDEATTFTGAGSETSASALSCALSLLGLYPEWQERAVEELRDVYGKGGDYLRSSTMYDLSQLVVIESILKETMRLFPTIPIGPYQSPEDIILDGGRYTAPQGSCVLVAYNLLHRQPDAFPDPDKFDPSRFLEGGSAMGRQPYSYLPFGAGPRMCVGARYAMVQMKVTLSAVLRRFRFLPGSTRDELENVILSIAAHPVTGYKVTCVPREAPQ